MQLAEIQALAALAARYGFEAIVAGLVVFLLLKAFLPGYLSEKGKNLATREDIGRITEEIERVKTQYAALLEELRSKNQLRLAAIDRRLSAHQEAFFLWRELLSKTHGPDIGSQVIKCQEWWEKNCLYLEPAAREAFSAAYSAASMHSSLLQNRDDVQAVKSNWAQIMRAGTVITEAAQLPGLTTSEKVELKRLEKEHASAQA